MSVWSFFIVGFVDLSFKFWWSLLMEIVLELLVLKFLKSFFKLVILFVVMVRVIVIKFIFLNLEILVKFLNCLNMMLFSFVFGVMFGLVIYGCFNIWVVVRCFFGFVWSMLEMSFFVFVLIFGYGSFSRFSAFCKMVLKIFCLVWV